MGTAEPPSAVVQRLQEENLRKDVHGYGSLGEALSAQGGRAEEATRAFDDALACCPAGVPSHLARAYAHYCGAYALLCEELGDKQKAQELYERMQKQSKNHVARAKRSVQGGHSPDEDLLLKAQKSCRELLEVDSEKVACADQLYDDLSRHLERCEGELHKFEEELREKGQLKTPANVKASAAASEPSSAGGTDGAAGGLSVQVGGAANEMPAPLGTGGRRGRQPSVSVMPEASPTSHKRGRGRKVSHKEAERQRAAQEVSSGGGH